VYILYLDESGSVGNINEQYFVLGGVAVFERQIHWISEELNKLAAAIWPDNPEALEFHASTIYAARKPPWRDMKDRAARQAAIKNVLKVVVDSHESTRVFACAIHKPSYPYEDPVELAFEDLCKRFDLYLQRMYSQGNPQRGLIVFDKSSYESGLQRLTRNLRISGTRWGKLRNLVEVPLFVDSKASRLLQLADHIAYSVFRRYESGDTSYLDVIINRFDKEGDKLHGLVHKHHTGPCMCPACLTRKLSPE